MNPEDYIIVNKKELEKEIISLKGDIKILETVPPKARDKYWDENRIKTIDKIRVLNAIISNSKPLQPLLEEIFEASRIMENYPEYNIFGAYKYLKIEDFIKDKEI